MRYNKCYYVAAYGILRHVKEKTGHYFTAWRHSTNGRRHNRKYHWAFYNYIQVSLLKHVISVNKRERSMKKLIFLHSEISEINHS